METMESQEGISIEQEEYNFYVRVTHEAPILTFQEYFARQKKAQDEFKARNPERFVNK